MAYDLWETIDQIAKEEGIQKNTRSSSSPRESLMSSLSNMLQKEDKGVTETQKGSGSWKLILTPLGSNLGKAPTVLPSNKDKEATVRAAERVIKEVMKSITDEQIDDWWQKVLAARERQKKK